MLFTDREIIALADLDAIEPGIDKVVTTESIPMTGENSLIRQAISDCSDEVMVLMQAYDSYPGSGDFDGDHVAHVFNGLYGTRNIPRVHLSQVCVNPRLAGTWSPIKTWVANHALYRIYRAAWNRRLTGKDGGDKYAAKADLFAQLAREALANLRAQGLPIVWKPLAQPAAVLDGDAGTWTAANLSATAGASAGVLCKVQVTWVDQTSYRNGGDKGNGESHPSPEANLTTVAGELLRVDISSLNVPAGFDVQTKGLASGITFPRPATGWNVYVNGVLQNAAPIPVSTKVYTLSADPATVGYRVGLGQYPDIYSVMPTGIPVYRA